MRAEDFLGDLPRGPVDLRRVSGRRGGTACRQRTAEEENGRERPGQAAHRYPRGAGVGAGAGAAGGGSLGIGFRGIIPSRIAAS